MRLSTLWLAWLAATAPAQAQQTEPFVEVIASPESVAVGEPIRLRVTIYVPTWFTTPPDWPSFEIPNAVTRIPPDSARPSSRRIGGDTWSGTTRVYDIYPLLGARFRVDSQSIRLAFADPGSDPVNTTAETGELEFVAYVPEGAETLDPYVAGTRFELSRDIDGDPTALEADDALVVTYTARLDGLPAMFLPEIVNRTDTPGVSVYPEQARVEDGDTATRTEKLTFIFQAGGEFEIPGVSIDWWNRETAQIETATVPPLPVTVIGTPLTTETEEPSPFANGWQLAAALLALLLAVRWYVAGADAREQRREDRERARLASEEYAWEQVQKALGYREARELHDALLHWLDRLGLDSRSFAARYGTPQLAAAIEDLKRQLYVQAGKADLATMAKELPRARRRCLEERRQSLQTALPPLNP